MALQQIPGQNSGFIATRYSSMNKRALGKFTDSNHIQMLHSKEPAMYDKKIISLYTQMSLYSNDFLQMIQKSKPYYIDRATDYWQWKVSVPYQFPTLVEIPDSTTALTNIGIDGQTFQLVFDKKEFFINDVITANRMYGQQFKVVEDPLPYGRAWLYTFVLITTNPLYTTVDPTWIVEGREFQFLYNASGEFTEKFSGLGSLGDEITLYQSLSSGNGVEHAVTDWADTKVANCKMGADKDGNPLDLIMYSKAVRNENGEKKYVTAWEPFIEMELRKRMLEMKVNKMVWSQGGTSRDRHTQELIKHSMGVYPQMRQFGNLEQYNDGQFSVNIIRNVFGDLFYRREDMKNRRVKMYTNEAGIEVFRTAAKDDLLKAGLTIIADERFIEGRGQKMTINWAFDSMVTMDTGRIEVCHLMELDLPQTNSEFGRNKKSTPVFMVFDVSAKEGGIASDNVREVRPKSAPSMTWGYIDGTYHHMGHAASQGMSSANMFPGYKMWFKDRYDVFIEDITRTVLIEQVPQF